MEEKIIPVNVEEIMKEIRQNIAERGETPDVLSFEEQTADQECEASFLSSAKFSEGELHQEIEMANSGHNIEYYQMIPAGGVKSFIKRSIRKVIAFVVQPLRKNKIIITPMSFAVCCSWRHIQCLTVKFLKNRRNL